MQPVKESLLAKMSLASGKLLDETFGEATDAECWAAERNAAADWIMANGHQAIEYLSGLDP